MIATVKYKGFGGPIINSATVAAPSNEHSGKTVSHKTAAEILMLVTTFCWASNIVAGKEALLGFTPLALAQLRMLLAALIYAVLYLLWPNKPKLHLARRQWLLLGLMAFTGITLNQICFLGGLARTSVTHTGLIQAVGPIMVLLLAALLGRETLTIQNCTGMTIAFTGVAILLIGKSGSENGAHWSGDLILLAAGASFALYTILMKDVAYDFDALTLSTLVFGLGALFLVPFTLKSVTAVGWQQVPLRAWAGLAYMVVFGSVVAYLIYAFALRALSASKAAAFAYLQSVMAVALGVWLIGERVTIQAGTGGILILLGVYLTERQRAREMAAGASKELELSRTAGLLHNSAIRRQLYARRLARFFVVIGQDCYDPATTPKETCRLILASLYTFSHMGAHRRTVPCRHMASCRKDIIHHPAHRSPNTPTLAPKS